MALLKRMNEEKLSPHKRVTSLRFGKSGEVCVFNDRAFRSLVQECKRETIKSTFLQNHWITTQN
jgi:hypothetical protein